MSLRKRPRRTSLLTAAVLSLLVLASCADPSSVKPDEDEPKGRIPEVKADPDVVRLVPEGVKDKGKLVFATNGPNAPIVFFKGDNKTLTGYTIELGDAIGATMGLKVGWKNISFDSVLPGLAARRYDAAMSSFSIEHERLPSADFVSYYLSGGGFLIKKGSGIRVNSFEGLCGYRVSVKKGVSQVEALGDASEYCRRHGKKPVKVLQVPDSNAVVLTLQSGRADVAMNDKPQILYAADRSNGQLCVTSVYQTSHSIAGIAVPKGSSLAKPLRAAVNSLLKSGVYDRIGDKWGTDVTEAGAKLSKKYRKLAAPWGVGPDGRVVESKIFKDPKEIKPGHTYYYQPLRKGCA
ncbi:ABC transporter substrate-binding protein [Streptomyces sp. HNM0575]|uniref:ABC transporter substrate-binding protein n=1 Tax=Streptomyces sp. HNM0575 TaxID=2716338 RepID=UPI00145C822A|nr:ABC transporter substrate-binding protein [Streptomyces sp. HNM0575]NLU75319.1 ABC transporter substrate-binding protein [Streptomyces sp. HNM0575]